MRLVLFTREFPKDSETFIVDKFLGLLERGWDVHLVAEVERPIEAPGCFRRSFRDMGRTETRPSFYTRKPIIGQTT